ncbi:plastocyanin [Rhodobium orientis]|uniref:Pilus formation protein N-terminal domain-containing protein n=1 Tax=Rhodobium orientis TaxID=34017 RepID=A0A327JQ61_9HYPH|nr:pilus assembly protein N-terminal domain-containing protein [Rhodobium orientis]MBB4304647.1 plastocyanin [Rhodobium orientis]MBK5950022.1 hypothetical protein [Rhodobium orientis]RAI27716.1 hypothetical protein CH339_09200 [Rhodobium orientis]
MFRPAKTASAASAIILGFLVLATASSAPALAKEPIFASVDRAKVMHIEGGADTIIVGNPAIADAVMHDANTLIIVGRGYGSTNLIVLNVDNEPIADETIIVRPNETSMVTVQRRGARYSYTCAPDCAPAPMPGDQVDYFDNTGKQTLQRNEAAQAAATGFKKK